MGELAADPRRDAKLRDVAQDIVEKIIERFAGHDGFTMIQAIRANGYYQTEMDIKTPAYGLEHGLPERLRFTVFFLPPGEEHTLASFGDKDGRPAMSFYLLPHNAELYAGREPELLWRHILRALDQGSGFIVHEITHMLDSLRGGLPLGKRGRKKQEEGDRSSWSLAKHRAHASRYVNSPEEFNAMFQEGMYDLSKHIEDANRGDTAYIMRSLRNFSKEADKMAGIRMLRAAGIRGKYLRKLEVRLWQTYEFWKEEMKKEMESS